MITLQILEGHRQSLQFLRSLVQLVMVKGVKGLKGGLNLNPLRGSRLRGGSDTRGNARGLCLKHLRGRKVNTTKVIMDVVGVNPVPP